MILISITIIDVIMLSCYYQIWPRYISFLSIHILLLLFLHIPANVQHLCFQVYVEQVLCGDEVRCSPWVLQSHVLSVCLLLCQTLHLLSHLFVSLHQVFCLYLSSSQLLLNVGVSVCLHFHRALVVVFEVFKGKGEWFLK